MSASVSTAYTHSSSIAYFYRSSGKPSVTENAIVTLYMKGLKRRNLGKTVNQATPMTTVILADLRKLLSAQQQPNLVTWRTVWRAHVEFGLMLRFDDIRR